MPGSPGPAVILAPEVNFLANKLIVWWQQPSGLSFGQVWNGDLERGHDYNMPYGAPVGAISGGQVVYAGLSPDSRVAGHTSLGYVVQIKNTDGSILHYQHLSSIPSNIVPGAIVSNAQVIGYSGGCAAGSSPGNCIPDQWSSGPHIEVRYSPTYNSSGGIWNQQWSDPVPYFQKLGASLTPGKVGTNTIGSAYGPTGQTATSTNCAPWDVACWWQAGQGTLVIWGEHIAVFLLAIVLIIVGFFLLAEKQVTSVAGSAAKAAVLA